MATRLYGLIPAAGTGERFAAGAAKQYTPLAGRPMLYHAVRALLAEPRIEMVFVVLARDDMTFRRVDWTAFGDRLAPLYCGGASRQESVLNGLVAASDTIDLADWVLVHDAARPCLAAPDVATLIDTLRDDEVGGILAVPVADTLKRADEDGRIAATERRDGLWQAQTPQMFRLGTLLKALEAAGPVTDEAGAVEALGLKPRLVRGRASNMKVTFAEDSAVATALLAHAMREGA